MRYNYINTFLLVLFVSVFNFMGYAQPTLDSANISTLPTDFQLYYVADSSASNLDVVTGANTTWDYSDLNGVGVTSENVIDSAHLSLYASDYPNSDIEDDLGSVLYVFRNNYADSIVSQGYVFNDPNYGLFRIILTDYLKLMEFPFTYMSSFSDAVDGTANAIILASPIPYYGSATVTGDGYGTLLLGTNTYTNVLRVKVNELSVIDPGTGTIPIQRTQYLYYEPSTSRFPLLMHNTISANGEVQSVVYSIDSLPVPVGIEDEEISTFSIYPNPTENAFTIASSISNKIERIEILDISGKLVAKPLFSVFSDQVVVNDPELNKGMYLLRISGDGFETVRSLVIQ